MGHDSGLRKIVGLEIDGPDRWLSYESGPAGERVHINSGVAPSRQFPVEHGSLSIAGSGLWDQVEWGPRAYTSTLVMDPRDPPEHFHVHPGGELTIVREGEYHDVDRDGNPIQSYKKGDWVWYTRFSAHAPRVGIGGGADLAYVTFNGMIRQIATEPFNLMGLLAKAKKAGIADAPDALDFLLHSLVADPDERRRLRTEAGL